MDFRLDLLKNYFMTIKAQNVEWHNLYVFNVEDFGKIGIYAYYNFPMEDSWKLVKYTILYQYARNKEFDFVDKDTKYYVLFKSTVSNLNCRIKFPGPGKKKVFEKH